MKVVLTLLCLCAAIVRVDGACSATTCVLGTDLGGQNACQTYRDYVNCLEEQVKGCTNSTSDNIIRDSLNESIRTANKAYDSLNCGSAAAGVSISVISLLLPLIAAVFKP